MNSEQAKESLVVLLAEAMQAKSLLAPHVARAAAEEAVQKLVGRNYLITNEKVYAVEAADFDGITHEYPDGPWDTWRLLTFPENWKSSEEENGTEGS